MCLSGDYEGGMHSHTHQDVSDDDEVLAMIFNLVLIVFTTKYKVNCGWVGLGC